MMYGQMTAGSWIYIGSQGIIQGTYETFSAAGEQAFWRRSERQADRLRRHGRNGRSAASGGDHDRRGFLGIEVDPERIKKRLRTGYCDFMVNSLDEALRILKNAVRKKENISVGLVGNCADVIPELAERGVVPDILTDQTSAHDPLNGYVPNGMTLEAALELRARDPKAYQERSLDAMARHVEGMLRLQKMGSVTFDYGNNIRTFAFQHGVKNAYDFPRIRARVHSPAVLRRARAVPLGGALGRTVGHRSHRRSGAGDVSGEPQPAPLDRSGAQAHQVPGTAGAHLLAGIWRARASSGWRSTSW